MIGHADRIQHLGRFTGASFPLPVRAFLLTPLVPRPSGIQFRQVPSPSIVIPFRQRTRTSRPRPASSHKQMRPQVQKCGSAAASRRVSRASAPRESNQHGASGMSRSLFWLKGMASSRESGDLLMRVSARLIKPNTMPANALHGSLHI